MTFAQRVDQAAHRWQNPSWWNLLVMFPWILGIILLVYEWNVDRNIAGHEQTTQGVITAHEPANHNRFGYVFTVNGKSFNGWESSGKDGLEIGHPVLVYYDPLNPNKNALTEFGDRGLSSLGPVPMMLFGIGAVAWYIRTKRRKNRAGFKSRSRPTGE